MALRDWLGPAALAALAADKAESGLSAATAATAATPEGSPTGPSAATAASAATPDQAAELRALLAIIAADWPDDEQRDALAAALADPQSALTCFRLLVAEREAKARTAVEVEPEVAPDPRMRSCRQCANLTAGGRCRAVLRGESLGDGIATARTWRPSDVDRPMRCGAYLPGPDDLDRRSGRERWPFLFGANPASKGRLSAT
ncbi:MAG TPA: hypothetical protein PLM09_15260 [Casimicrobiaceae bacterium]|nr:hypothetical protein [Casimicrobiaceae bacterium]